MSENKIRRDLSRYDALTTEELEQLLRASVLIEDEDEEYLETVVYIAEVYAQRKKQEEGPAPETTKKQKKPFIKRFIRAVAAAAAVVVLVLCGTVTAKSMGFDLWGAVAEWTSSIFTFDTPEATLSNADPLETIERMKPKWLPEGFELMYETLDKDDPLTYHASYEKDGKTINLTYQKNVSNNTDYLEKGEGEVEVYEVNELPFYIFKNKEFTAACWYSDGLVCRISGDITVNEVKKIIDSVGIQ